MKRIEKCCSRELVFCSIRYIIYIYKCKSETNIKYEYISHYFALLVANSCKLVNFLALFLHFFYRNIFIEYIIIYDNIKIKMFSVIYIILEFVFLTCAFLITGCWKARGKPRS